MSYVLLNKKTGMYPMNPDLWTTKSGFDMCWPMTKDINKAHIFLTRLNAKFAARFIDKGNKNLKNFTFIRID